MNLVFHTLFLFHPPLLLLSFSLAQSPSLVSPSAPSSYLTSIFSVLSLLQCSYPKDRSQTTSSAIHLTDPKPLSQCDKCDLLILWRGSPSMQTPPGTCGNPMASTTGSNIQGGVAAALPWAWAPQSAPLRNSDPHEAHQTDLCLSSAPPGLLTAKNVL